MYVTFPSFDGNTAVRRLLIRSGCQPASLNEHPSKTPGRQVLKLQVYHFQSVDLHRDRCTVPACESSALACMDSTSMLLLAIGYQCLE